MYLNDYFEIYRNKPCEKSLTDVLQASQPLIFGIVVKVANHAHDAEDISQEILIKVIQNINILPKKINFGGWLNRVSLNAAIDHYHQKQRIKVLKPTLQEKNKINSVENEDENIAIIYQHLSKLDSNEESLILNKYIHLLTYDLMSILYKQTRTTIESKIKNILERLKSSIEKAGFADVALAVLTSLDQLKATEISIDLLAKIKNQYPKTYPKVNSKIFSNKILLNVLVPVVAVLVGLFKIDHIKSSNKTNNTQLTELGKIDKGPTAKIETNSKNQTVAKNDESETEIIIKENNTNGNDNLSPIAIEEPKAVVENDFAGQLIDAETKKPIPGAKLEIWDIYTYEKVETITDAEGTYFVPKGLDTTFFFYLKFTKDGYAVKQTFQHFEINKNISLKINKGEIVSCKLNFGKPSRGELYLGPNCHLEK